MRIRDRRKMELPNDLRLISLKYAGRCRECARELEVGKQAYWSRSSKSVWCVDCTHDNLSTAQAEVGSAPGTSQDSARKARSASSITSKSLCPSDLILIGGPNCDHIELPSASLWRVNDLLNIGIRTSRTLWFSKLLLPELRQSDRSRWVQGSPTLAMDFRWLTLTDQPTSTSMSSRQWSLEPHSSTPFSARTLTSSWNPRDANA